MMPSPIRVQRWGSSPASGQQPSTIAELLGVAGGGVGDGAGALVLAALVHEQGGVAAVVEDHVRPLRALAGLGAGPEQRLFGAPPVLLERLALPREHGHPAGALGGARGADRDRGGGVVLGGEDVAAAPAHDGAQAVSVSIRTAVWTVMCSEPVMRAPFSGWASPYSRRSAISPGISCSASVISLRPNSARERSATLKSAVRAAVVAVIADTEKPPVNLGERPCCSLGGRAWRIAARRSAPRPQRTLAQGSIEHGAGPWNRRLSAVRPAPP